CVWLGLTAIGAFDLFITAVGAFGLAEIAQRCVSFSRNAARERLDLGLTAVGAFGLAEIAQGATARGAHIHSLAGVLGGDTYDGYIWFSLLPGCTVKFGNDHVAKILGYGDYQIGNVTISRVCYIEGLGHNLFSVGQLCDSNLEVAFRQHTCFIRNLEGVDLLTGSRGNNLYTLSLGDMMASSPICLLSKASKTKTYNGTEFVNQTLREYYEKVGISHETSVARSPQQNGVVERQYDSEASSLDVIPTVVQTAAPNSEHFKPKNYNEAFNSKHVGFEAMQEVKLDEMGGTVFRLQDMQLIHKLHDDKKCMKKVEPSSKSKAIKDIISIGSFMEVLVLNHYVLVRKIFDPVDTPMVEKYKLDEDTQGKAVDPTHYRGMAKPTEKHLHAVKRIFKYLRGTINRGLWYPKDSSIALTAYADADQAEKRCDIQYGS
ncbi:integrase, catalytic region, zinc finger, CCHC-type containing protein, partial [Tanacetum coccineum]